MRCFYSFFQDHNTEWSEAERNARWHEAELKAAERRARKAKRANALPPFSGDEVEKEDDAKYFMKVRFNSFRRRRDQTNDIPLWSLGMTIVWIMWRDFGRVTEMQNEPFLSHSRICLESSRDTLAGVRLSERLPDEAFRQISIAAQKGQISFTGIGADNEPLSIDRTKWAYIAPPYGSFTQVKWKAGGEAYRDLYASREVILTLWPAATAWKAPLPGIAATAGLGLPQVEVTARQSDKTPQALAERSNVSEADVRRWFVNEFLPANQKQVPKTTIEKAAWLAMPAMTRPKIRKVMEQNWPAEWSPKSGPKGPRTGKNNPAE